MLITPANTPLFVRWEGYENCLKIQMPESFLKRVVEETLGKDGDRLTVIPTFQSRNQQLEAISTLLMAEVQQRQASRGLYFRLTSKCTGGSVAAQLWDDLGPAAKL